MELLSPIQWSLPQVLGASLSWDPQHATTTSPAIEQVKGEWLQSTEWSQEIPEVATTLAERIVREDPFLFGRGCVSVTPISAE
jgi:hypothetical protein